MSSANRGKFKPESRNDGRCVIFNERNIALIDLEVRTIKWVQCDLTKY